MTESINQLERILPLPYLPTYIARRPKKISTYDDDDEIIDSFNPIFASNWSKASDNYATKHRSFYDSPYINIEIESMEPIPKQYDTYKPSYKPQYELNSTDILNRVRPLTVPNHTTRTSENWSRFLDRYPDRFKINYPLADENNDLYIPSRPGRYPYLTTQESLNHYSGLASRIEPVMNTFRQSQSRQKSMVAYPIWLPYGTAPRHDQKPARKEAHK